jgi:hypothetical protein
MNNSNVYKMIDIIVDNNIDKIAKMKKAEILAFTKSLLTDYLHELDNDTINELYNEAR